MDSPPLFTSNKAHRDHTTIHRFTTAFSLQIKPRDDDTSPNITPQDELKPAVDLCLKAQFLALSVYYVKVQTGGQHRCCLLVVLLVTFRNDL